MTNNENRLQVNETFTLVNEPFDERIDSDPNTELRLLSSRVGLSDVGADTRG